jgi:hypothetical protein
MITKQYGFILEAQTPVAHHEESLGNISTFMRRKVRQPDGSWARVCYVTGDTMRHALRESAAYAFLDAAGLLGSNLSEGAVRLLFSGGMMTGRGDAGVVNMDRFREMSTLCPPLALMGGCADNRSIPGRMQVDEATLICSEQERYLPEWVREWLGSQELTSQRQALEEVQRVRMDPSLDPGKRALMLPDAQVEVSRRLTAGEVAHATDDAVMRDEAKSTMMPRRYERLAQGSQFYWRVTAHCLSDLDVDAFHVMIGALMSNCVIGGKKGTGHGLLRVVAARDIRVARPAERAEVVDVTDLGPRVGSLFFDHVKQHRSQIADWLSAVNA